MNDIADLFFKGAFIKFLGTGGARFVMINQTRSTGGIWLGLFGYHVLIDPGPGSLVKICEAGTPFTPEILETVMLTHKHLDHSNDINVMVEAITHGGFKRRGTLILPRDAAMGEGQILLSHFNTKIGKIHYWEDKRLIPLCEGMLEAVRLIHHGVECYGFILRYPEIAPFGFISDTRYDEEIVKRYKGCKVLVVNMTFNHIRNGIDHLAVDHVALIRDLVAPELIMLNHFGRGVIDAGPEKIASSLTIKSCKIIAPFDGQMIDLKSFESFFEEDT